MDNNPQNRARRPGIPMLIVSHALLAALVAAVLLPGQKKVDTPVPFLVAIALVEVLYLYTAFVRRKNPVGATDLLALGYGLLLLWEIFTTKLDKMHPVLVPAPENVFNVFATQWPVMLRGVAASLSLLAVGIVLGVSLGVLLGLLAGWVPRLHGICFPVAQVMAPIPPIVYAPYLIALMPTFRSASALVIFLGIFWPTFLNMILRVEATPPRILDTAKTLGVTGAAMVPKILLPCVLPGVVGGLKVTLATSVMLLCFAEMMGATSGMGYFIINFAHYANYTNVVAGIILVGAVVTVLNTLVDVVRKKAIKWQ